MASIAPIEPLDTDVRIKLNTLIAQGNKVDDKANQAALDKEIAAREAATQIATQAEAQDGTSNTVLMTPVRTTQHYNSRISSVNQSIADEAAAREAADAALQTAIDGKASLGQVTIATLEEAQAGTSNTVLMTPLRTQQFWNSHVGSVNERITSETSERKAADADLQAAINGKADLSQVTKATVEEAQAGTSNAVLMTPLRTQQFWNSHIIEVNTAIAGKADAEHTHEMSDINGLDVALGEKASTVDLAAVAITGSAGDLVETTTAKVMTDFERAKLADIEQNATRDMTPGEIAAAYESIATVERFTTAYMNKLSGIAAGATANATNAQLRDRTTHTGEQAIATVTGLQAALDAKAAIASLADVATSGTAEDLTEGDTKLLLTVAERAKLSGITSGADVSPVTSVAGKTGVVVLTKADVGLGNVDNTADADKPISTATQTALAAKANAADLAEVATSGSAGDIIETTAAKVMTAAERTKLAGITAGADVSPVRSVAGRTGAVVLSKADVGLDDVDNTADMDKPVSTAQAAAIDAAIAVEVVDRDTAIATAVGDEAAARQAAIDAEVVARDAAIDAAIDAEVIARDAAIAEAVETDAAATDNLHDSLISGARSDPGLTSELYSSALVGKGADMPPIAIGAPSTSNRYGTVWRIAGDDVDEPFIDVAPREDFPIRAGQVFQVMVAVERVTDPIDPLNDAVEVRVQNLNRNHANISDVRYGEPHELLVDTGALEVAFTIGRAPLPDGVTVDYTVPATTRYIRPHVRLYGGPPHVTDVAVIDVDDITALATLEASLLAEIEADKSLSITGLSVNPGVAEVGSTPTPTLSWGYSGTADVVAQAINGDSIAAIRRNWTAPAPISADASYTLTATGSGGQQDSGTVSVRFRTRVWWGTLEDPESAVSADILAMEDSALADSRAREVTIHDPNGRYVGYAYPASFGPPVEVSTPLGPIDYNMRTLSVTNTHGDTRNYRLIWLVEQQFGTSVTLIVE